MKTSLIFNTAVADLHKRRSHNPFRRSPYGARWNVLVDELTRNLGRYDEIIVVGSFPEPVPMKAKNLKWVQTPARYHDRRDALWQRETGARFSTGDVLVFSHDDHAPAFGKRDIPRDGWDILVPKRVHAITGETLNNGRDEDYMGGHTLCMRRDLWARVPWTSVDTEYWDLPMTRIWRDAGARIVFSDDLVHLDIEALADER